MISLLVYKLIHLVGIIMAMAALGGAALYAMAGGSQEKGASGRRVLAIFHGIGVFLVLLGGFGMLARLGIVHGGGFPGWIWVKLTIWVLVAGALFLPRRRPASALPLLLALPVLGGLAAYMAIYKPF